MKIRVRKVRWQLDESIPTLGCRWCGAEKITHMIANVREDWPYPHEYTSPTSAQIYARVYHATVLRYKMSDVYQFGPVDRSEWVAV